MGKSLRYIVYLVVLLVAIEICIAANCGGEIQCNCGDALIESHTMWYDLTDCHVALFFESDNITLDCDGYAIDGNGSSNGLYLYNRTNITVENCFLTEFHNAIQFSHGTNMTIQNNVMYNNTAKGIYLHFCADNILYNNYVYQNEDGILLSNSVNNTVIRNKAYYNDDVGIYLSTNSGYTNVSHNTAVGNRYGFDLFHSKHNFLYNNSATMSNAFFGSGFRLGSESHNNVLYWNTADHNYYGIVIDSSDDNIVQENDVHNNSYRGISVFGSERSTVSGNSITSCSYGMLIGSSSYINVSGNIIINNSDGVKLSFGLNNTIQGNTIFSNANNGITLEDSDDNILESNTIAGHNNDSISISECMNNIVINNTLTNSRVGIYADDVHDGIVYNNTIIYNQEGLRLHDSNSNTIAGNIVTNNSICGITMSASSNNLIYNNFFNNTLNANDTGVNKWNTTRTFGRNILWDRYLGGNYWSDYAGNDSDVDGFGDTEIPHNSSGNIQNGGDMMPLAILPPVNNIDTEQYFYLIQDAIDNTNTTDGHTIVADSSTYYEHLVINKSLNLVGQQRNYTIVDGNGSASVIKILADYVNVSGFNVRKSGDYTDNAGIRISSDFVRITDNIVGPNKYHGLYFSSSENNVITDNVIQQNQHDGINLGGSQNTIIAGNNIRANGYKGILIASRNNTLIGNIFHDNHYGIDISSSTQSSIIEYNNVTNSYYGIRLTGRNLTFSDNIVDKNQYGFYFSSGCADNIITGNYITQNNIHGIKLSISSRNNTFFNNYISNTDNVDANGRNYWNITKTPGTNIFGGPYLGGNYWNDYSGVDIDFDGLGDTSIPHNSTGGIRGDEHPLAIIYPVVNLDTPKGFWTIQSAINDFDTVDGDRILIHYGTYFENLLVYKSVEIVGERRGATTIDGSEESDVIKVIADYVNITNLTVQHAGHDEGDYGIEISSDKCHIYYNNITSNWYRGISLWRSENNLIANNSITYNKYGGIVLNSSHNTTIHDNRIIFNNVFGIGLAESSNNSVFQSNISSNHGRGIIISGSVTNTISTNHISLNDEEGIRIMSSFNHTILSNKILSNGAVSVYGIFLDIESAGSYIYNNYLNNTDNAGDEGNNSWNITKTPGKNIVNGDFLGGNYWHDYAGKDNDEDGIGDTLLPYNNSGHIPGDWLPLVAISCGEVITDDTVLTNDLLDCESPGLIIGADNITLDCNDHLIDGNGSFNGILLYNKTGVVIKDCAVEDFEIGIFLNMSTGSDIRDNNLAQNHQYGAYLTSSEHNTFLSNTLKNSFEDSDNNKWNTSFYGNYWVDYENNSGHPFFYEVSGPGNGVDWHPLWQFECGDNVSFSATMMDSILNCTGNGLNVVQDNITLFCFGNIIQGAGTGIQVINPVSVSIVISSG